jgi:hypothetical protein
MSVKIVSPREMIIEAINLFESVGMQRAGVTRITFAMYDPEKLRELIGGGKKTGKYFEDKSPAWLRRWLPEIISDCNTRQESVIINHPEGDGVTLFQCDDISEDALRRVQHLAFIVFCTSPGSYQAWFCVPSQDEESDKDFKGRCKRGNADMSATGSTRVVGSTNFKDKYGPGYPTITISHAAPGRRTTREGLAEALGVDLAAEEPKPLPAPVLLYSVAISGRSGNRWPDYARCHRGSSDPSGSDFTWCRQAFGWAIIRHR